MQPHRGTMILVFGILGILVCQIFSFLAWIQGKGDLAEMEAGRMDPEGEQNTKVGMILGIVGVVLFVLTLLLVGGVFLFVGGAAFTQGG